MKAMNKFILVVGLLVLTPGCQGSPGLSSYSTVPPDPQRNTDLARQCNARGVALIRQGNLDEAQKVLKQAVEADLFFGPAHNNLGAAYFRRQEYYLAAWEFQYAAKLMPHKVEPLNNLGLVLEGAGKRDEAEKSYQEALALEPQAVEVAANLASLYVRDNRKDDKTRELLTQVARQDDRADWRSWAQDRLALLGEPQSRPAAAGKELGQ
jgi:Flp pilus assembly protein TadD